ncbi:MAG: hypothetical protein JXA33_16405 [Anaerolineae bacterium]|nr:hypothetical protein [Anaerolineae bacterium]
MMVLCMGLVTTGMLVGCGSGWETLDESILCTEKPENFAPLSRLSYDVTIHDVQGPTVNLPPAVGQDFFEWFVFFKVDRTAGESGYIIQEVNHDFKSYRSDGSLQAAATPPLRYWEVWVVDKDQIHTHGHLSETSWDDYFFQRGNPSHSKGYVENTSIVRFYEGILPDCFVADSIAYAGSLSASETAPDFWEYSGTVHALRLEWDLTASDEQNWWWRYTVRRGNQQRSESWGKIPTDGLALP